MRCWTLGSFVFMIWGNVWSKPLEVCFLFVLFHKLIISACITSGSNLALWFCLYVFICRFLLPFYSRLSTYALHGLGSS